MPTLTLTTNPGLEAIVEAELRERLGAAAALTVRHRPYGLAGHVQFDCDTPFDQLWPVVQAMRSIHHVLRCIDAFSIPAQGTLDAIYQRLLQTPIAEMPDARAFRVTTKRTGRHDFSSEDVQRRAGAALVARYGTAVDLRGHDVNVRVDVIHQMCLVSVQLTRATLSNRHRRVYNPRAALKPTVAYALLRLVDPPADGALLDPFCGAGTIPLEAAQMHPDMTLCAGDINEQVVRGIQQNAVAEHCADRLDVRQVDARYLTRYYTGPFDAIVANPPYGVRLGRKANFTVLYQRFLKEAHALLKPGGRLAVLVFKHAPFERVLREQGLFAKRTVQIIETGGVYPHVYVLRPVAAVATTKSARAVESGPGRSGACDPP